LDQLLKEVLLLRRDMDAIRTSLSKHDKLERRVRLLEQSVSQVVLPEGVVNSPEEVENIAPPTRHVCKLSSRPMAVCAVSKKSL
jgi:hypothetical protein